MNSSSARRFPYFGQEGIGGGLTSENPIIARPNQMVEADNVLVGTAISRRKRGGTLRYHTGTAEGTVNWPEADKPIRGVYDYWQVAGIAQPQSFVVMHSDTKIWAVEGRTNNAVDITGALTLPADGVPCYQVFDGTLYMTSTDVTHGYVRWAGTGNAVAATAPADGPGKYLCHHLGRMVMAGNNDFPYRVYISSALDPEEWGNTPPADATSLDLVDEGDPEGITGITSFQNRLYVFLRRSIYEITGSTVADLVVQKISNGIGCIGHASIAQVPNDVIFCSDRGVHSLRQLDSGRITESTFLSRDIQRLWTELLNAALYSRVVAVYDEPTNNYIISVPSSGQLTNDQILCFNIEYGTWTRWTGISARWIGRVLLGNKNNLISGGETGILSILNQNENQDLGSGYTYRWKSGVLYPGGDLTVEKRFINITILASTTRESSLTIGWNIDGKKSGSKNIQLSAGLDALGTSFILGQSKLGIGQYLPKTVGIEDVGYGIQIEVVCGGDSNVEFYGYILEVEDVNQNYI